MKKTTLTLLSLAGVAWLGQATVYLNEPFAYPDGPLVTVASGLWLTHSGTTGQVDVASGKVNLAQTESEDVSASVTNVLGRAITNGYLYAGFKVNFSALPLGNGTYFWHFRDSGIMNFRARVFATVINAAPGSFRFGIAAGGNTPVVIPADCSPGTDYKLVVRYDVVNATATLWINPPSEATSANRADTTDTTTSVGIQFVCLRQSTASGNGMGVLTLDDLVVGTAFTDVQTPGGPPTIGGATDQHIPANTSTGPLPFVVDDVETPADSLVVTGTSDNPTVVPNAPAHITLGGSGTNRTVTVTPAAGQQGLATIELVVTDGDGNTATNSFKVYVGEPTISALADQISPTNTVLGPLAFTVNDTETAPGSLSVTPTSDNEAVVPAANISIANLGGPNRTVTVTPAADAAGTATITLTVSDGTWDIPTRFKVTFYPKLGLVLGDDFSYPDGSIITNSGFFWNAHSGATGQTQVIQGRLSLSSTNSEDISALLTNVPYAPGGGYVFYARFLVNFSALPGASASGEYFAHFREFTGGIFRGRVFASTSGAAPGSYRIGVANGGFTTVFFPRDLLPGAPYVVIVRYNNDTAQTTLWINPAAETSPGVTATDPASPITIYTYAFRQSSGIGTLTVDDLKIGTTFDDVWISVIPSPEPLQYSYANGTLTLSWTDPAFVLQAAPTVTGAYTNVPGATSPWPVPAGGEQMYFRLKY